MNKQHPVKHETPIFVPNKYDILCGSGHSVFNHPGNALYRSIVEERAEDYANAPCKLIRSRVVKSILSEVRATCGNVLKKDPIFQFWHVANNAEKVLRDKTTHCLRAFLSRKSRGVRSAPQAKYDHGNNGTGMSPLFQLEYWSLSTATTKEQGESLNTLPVVRTIQEMKESPPLPLSEELQALDPWMRSLLCRCSQNTTLEDEASIGNVLIGCSLGKPEDKLVDKKSRSIIFLDEDYNEDSNGMEWDTSKIDWFALEESLHPDGTPS